MAEGARRYVFGPLERRGLFLGLGAGQLATLVGGGLVGLITARVVGGRAGVAVGAVFVMAGVAGSLMHGGGRPLASWLPLMAAYLCRRTRSPVLSDAPLRGVCTGAGDSGRAGREVAASEGVVLFEAADLPGEEGFGVLGDRRAGHLVAVVPVRGRSFSLLDPAEQAGRLDAWRAVLASLARSGTPVRRIQWVERSAPAGDLRSPARSNSTLARESYCEVVQSTAADTRLHEVWVAIAVGARPRLSGSAPAGRALEVLRREVRLLEGQIRGAGLSPGRPLCAGDLAGVISALQQCGGGGASTLPWAIATDESWSAHRSGGAWHATFWIAEWPRIEVPPDFLVPLLLAGGSRTVAVTMAPEPAERALREARSSRTADAADEHLREKAGFLPSIRRGREAEGALRREAELADGHAEYRFSGYVTVTAPERGALDAACAEATHAARSAHLELCRLYGRQAEAFTWTLPLARGLR